jgi:hypothetical protein
MTMGFDSLLYTQISVKQNKFIISSNHYLHIFEFSRWMCLHSWSTFGMFNVFDVFDVWFILWCLLFEWFCRFDVGNLRLDSCWTIHVHASSTSQSQMYTDDGDDDVERMTQQRTQLWKWQQFVEEPNCDWFIDCNEWQTLASAPSFAWKHDATCGESTTTTFSKVDDMHRGFQCVSFL